MNLPDRLVLASGSPTRLALLRRAAIYPEVVVSGVDESTDGIDTPHAVAVLAERKASAVAPLRPGRLVLGCDSLLDLDDEPLGKPGSAVEATVMWRRLWGRDAVLYTGHCLIDDRQVPGRPHAERIVRVAQTVVRFGRPTEHEISSYVSSGEPLGLAGAFSIDGLGAPFVDGIDGDPSNVLGLSLPVLRHMLGSVGVSIVDLWEVDTSAGAHAAGD
ncbi:MAG: nucleoside triphosphate pyrophosphatase [Acidimicrobiales bacterium]